ncbi:MAG TPA: GspMb/PilO family protein [Terriglobales bacterium]|nr:GspMb/PilO family protein [Terriglobales bacterium]
MPDVKDARRKLTAVLVALLIIDIACGIVLISPIGRAARTSQNRLHELWTELQQKTREALPLRGIDEKVVQADTQIQQFYKERLPEKFANVPDALGRVASANGVRMAAAQYKTEPTEVPALRRVVVEATFSGGYGQVMRFINALEREKTFFIIDAISLGGQQASGQNPGSVQLQMRVETYIRNEAAA